MSDTPKDIALGAAIGALLSGVIVFSVAGIRADQKDNRRIRADIEAQCFVLAPNAVERCSNARLRARGMEDYKAKLERVRVSRN